MLHKILILWISSKALKWKSDILNLRWYIIFPFNLLFFKNTITKKILIFLNLNLHSFTEMCWIIVLDRNRQWETWIRNFKSRMWFFQPLMADKYWLSTHFYTFTMNLTFKHKHGHSFCIIDMSEIWFDKKIIKISNGSSHLWIVKE